MGRKKKVEEELVVTNIEEQQKEIKVLTKEINLFSIKAITENARLRKLPSIKDSSDNIQGKLKKGEICAVTCELNYTPVKMYRLSNGYYVIADQNIQVI